jgi:hypothetical protein
MSYSKTRKPSIYKTNKTLRVALLYFKSIRLLTLYKYKVQHLYKKRKTNLGGEGEIKVKQGAEVVVDLIIPYYIIAYHFE